MVPKTRAKDGNKDKLKRQVTQFGELDTTPTSRFYDVSSPSKQASAPKIQVNDTVIHEAGESDVQVNGVDLVGLQYTAHNNGSLPMGKEFTWSEPVSSTRRSSPLQTEVAAKDIWEFEDEDLLGEFSSPQFGSGNLPETMPLQAEQSQDLQTRCTINDIIDLSETASTLHRSTSVCSKDGEDQLWDFIDTSSVGILSTRQHLPAEIPDSFVGEAIGTDSNLNVDEIYKATPPRSAFEIPSSPSHSDAQPIAPEPTPPRTIQKEDEAARGSNAKKRASKKVLDAKAKEVKHNAKVAKALDSECSTVDAMPKDRDHNAQAGTYESKSWKQGSKKPKQRQKEAFQFDEETNEMKPSQKKTSLPAEVPVVGTLQEGRTSHTTRSYASENKIAQRKEPHRRKDQVVVEKKEASGSISKNERKDINSIATVRRPGPKPSSSPTKKTFGLPMKQPRKKINDEERASGKKGSKEDAPIALSSDAKPGSPFLDLTDNSPSKKPVQEKVYQLASEPHDSPIPENDPRHTRLSSRAPHIIPDTLTSDEDVVERSQSNQLTQETEEAEHRRSTIPSLPPQTNIAIQEIERPQKDPKRSLSIARGTATKLNERTLRASRLIEKRPPKSPQRALQHPTQKKAIGEQLQPSYRSAGHQSIQKQVIEQQRLSAEPAVHRSIQRKANKQDLRDRKQSLSREAKKVPRSFSISEAGSPVPIKPAPTSWVDASTVMGQSSPSSLVDVSLLNEHQSVRSSLTSRDGPPSSCSGNESKEMLLNAGSQTAVEKKEHPHQITATEEKDVVGRMKAKFQQGSNSVDGSKKRTHDMIEQDQQQIGQIQPCRSMGEIAEGLQAIEGASVRRSVPGEAASANSVSQMVLEHLKSREETIYRGAQAYETNMSNCIAKIEGKHTSELMELGYRWKKDGARFSRHIKRAKREVHDGSERREGVVRQLFNHADTRRLQYVRAIADLQSLRSGL